MPYRLLLEVGELDLTAALTKLGMGYTSPLGTHGETVVGGATPLSLSPSQCSAALATRSADDGGTLEGFAMDIMHATLASRDDTQQRIFCLQLAK